MTDRGREQPYSPPATKADLQQVLNDQFRNLTWIFAAMLVLVFGLVVYFH